MTAIKLEPLTSLGSLGKSKVSRSMPVRITVVAVVILAALAAQLVLGSTLSARAVAPNLALLLVVAAGVARGRDFAAFLGFGLGLALDLGPASDHLAGRWALALVIVGYLVGTAGRRRVGSPPHRLVLVGLGVVASFVGTSVFALTGLLLSDPATSVPEVLQVILAASASDGLLALLVLPYLIGVFDQIMPAQDS